MSLARSLCAVTAGILSVASPSGAQRTDTTFVSVHGHRVALYVTGASGPLVVMEAGGGSWHRDWVDVVPPLAKTSRVITYDRPGYGLSEPCDSPRTAERVSRELNDALEGGGFRGPLLVVGWSLGGAFARVFAANFPGLVSGLVLVDPAPEDFYRRIVKEYPDEWSREVMSRFPVVYGDSSRRAEQLELAAFESSMEQARTSDAAHQTPTLVLIADREEDVATDPISRLWVAELTRWAARRPNTTTRVVSRSGHHIPRQHPRAVVEAVHDMLARRK